MSMTGAATSSTLAGPAAADGLQASGMGLYDNGRWVWRHVDLGLRPGERVALTGPSGSGKTAMLLALAGLLQPTEGGISLEGRPIEQWSMTAYRCRVGYLPQRAVLDDGRTVEDVLLAPFAFRAHRHRRFPRDRVGGWLRALGRDESFLHRHVSALSGGEQQLAALLRLLAVEPSLLLLDEPTASMDAGVSRRAEQLLNDWVAEEATRGWLWVSHSEQQLAKVADRVVEIP